jgi:hypothetical protein
MKLRRYESETTAFIKEFLERNPEVVDRQKRHRATWWDRPQDRDERERLAQAEVAQRGYVYYDNA